jgi:hypothetical protein
VKASVIKSTQSSNGGFVTTLAVSKSVPGLGTVQTRRYIKTSEAALIGAEFDLDPSMFQEITRTVELADENGEVRQQDMTWLSLRVGA